MFAVAGCATGTAPSPEGSDAPPPPPLVMEGVRLTYSERGDVQHVLVAKHLVRTSTGESAKDAQDNVVVDGGFTLYLGGDEREHSSTLTAVKGTLDEASLRLVAEDAVVLQNAAGDRLETEYLVWNEDSNRVYTNRAVTIYTADGVLHGRGLESDGRFERYRILQPTGELSVPEPR